MENFALTLLLKPFAALVLFTLALLIARWLFPLIPDGPVKRVLYDPTLRARYPWRFALLFMGAAWGGMALAAWLTL